jgi:hypothetical protein
MREVVEWELVECRRELLAILETPFRPNGDQDAVVAGIKGDCVVQYPEGKWERASGRGQVIWTLVNDNGREVVKIYITSGKIMLTVLETGETKRVYPI